MLNDFKRKQAQPESVFAAEQRQSEGGNARKAARAGVPSLISADVVITGSLHAAGEVQFDGEIEGDLQAGGLVIGEGATAKGTVTADRLKVSGRIEGTVRAGKVSLAATAVVEGELIHSQLEVEDGARLEGKVRRVENHADGAALPADKIKAELAEQPNMRGLMSGEKAPEPEKAKDGNDADRASSASKEDPAAIARLSKAS